MFNHKLLESAGTLARTLCALSLALACAPALSETGKSEAERPRYQMAVFSDIAHGMKILSGEYDQAITKIHTNAQSADELHVQTNLCVAYAKSGDIDAAEDACDEAVVAAKSLHSSHSSSFIGVSSAQLRARYLAITLSNRGVVRAISGDLEAAREDFDAAMAQRSGVSTIKANLERIKGSEESV
jgi:tetratricopeptide (TPR) repeat protein